MLKSFAGPVILRRGFLDTDPGWKKGMAGARENARLARAALVLALGLTACDVGYLFSGVQAIADAQGRVHAAASVDIETEGGGGLIRVDVASFGPDGLERSRLDASRLADQGVFVDGDGALLLIAEHELGAPGLDAPPLARLGADGWTAVSVSPGLVEEARVALEDAEILGVGWTDAAGSTRLFAPATGLGGWVYDLQGGQVTGAAFLEPVVTGALQVDRPARDRLGAWVVEPLAGCKQPWALACDGAGCAWSAEGVVCLGRSSSSVGHTAAGTPVAASPEVDPDSGQTSIALEWPGGEASLSYAFPADQVLGLDLAPRARGGLLVAAHARFSTTLGLLVLEEDFSWRELSVDVRTGALLGLEVLGTEDAADGELAQLLFASHARLTRVTVVLATGEQRRETLPVD